MISGEQVNSTQKPYEDLSLADEQLSFYAAALRNPSCLVMSAIAANLRTAAR